MNRSPLPWYRSTLGYALAGAGVLWAALPPLDLWPLAWIAPLWWVLLIRQKELAGRRPYGSLWLAGFLFWLAVLHWLRLPHPATSIGWVALSFYFAFYLPLFVGLCRVAVHRLGVPVISAAPVVWTALELVRAHLLTGMTMASLGHTQYRWIALIQISDLAGAFGVSFVVMFVAACFARMLPCNGKPRAIWPAVPAAVLMAAVLVYAAVRTSAVADSAALRIALIQGSIDTTIKSDPRMRQYVYEHYRALSELARQRYQHLDLIVWPETVFRDTLITYEPGQNIPTPEDFKERDWTDGQFQAALEDTVSLSQREMGRLVRHFGTAMIIGVDNHHFTAEGMKVHNTAALVRRDGKLAGVYRKNHRVMFGEYTPFVEDFPWLQHLTPLAGNITPGDKSVAFDVGGVCIAPNICYESVLSHVIRRQVNTLAARGTEPDVLVNLTNDGWFWGSSELDLHLICGVFRAVECRKPFLVAANTGFSAWIDADGRIRQQGPRRDTAVLLAEVAADPRRSWYLRHGDWPAGVCLAACVVFAAAGLWDRARHRFG